MHRKTVHRGIAALVLTAALILAGATPAAAAELDFYERSLRWLASLVGGEERESAGSPEPGRGLLDGILSLWEADYTDKGLGCDPNGTQTCSMGDPGEEIEEH